MSKKLSPCGSSGAGKEIVQPNPPQNLKGETKIITKEQDKKLKELAQQMIDTYGISFGKIEIQAKNKRLVFLNLSEGIYTNEGQVIPIGGKF